jgi:hypothetical protein
MTEPPAPERIAVVWSPEARTDLRAISGLESADMVAKTKQNSSFASSWQT